MKFLKWLENNILFVLTLFFLAFIPLYPKLPIIDIKHTWVYIRIEDFLVAVTLLIFVVQLVRKKVTIKTPLTLPIVFFWLAGLISTIFAVVFIFPQLANVFPSIAGLHYLRRIEYLSLFFIGFSAIKDKKQLTVVITTLMITLLCVVGYGIGQRYFGFPAFLTMNEEFAKGIPLRLSALSRVPSTFAGHYDLAAYLVLMIPIMGSMVFGFKNIFLKLLYLLSAVLGLVLLLMTASRVSFGVYLVVITFMLILLRKKLFILPVIVASILLLNSFSGISQRFGSTFSQVDLIVDARTGQAIGIAKETGDNQIIIEDKQSTGENLPEGSKYINIPSGSDTVKSDVIIRRKRLGRDGQEQEIISRSGEVIVKKAFAYDVSFTTRFQGQWPRAVEAFNRNIFLGSGYSSINIATDNNYLRILGEVGIVGFIAFISIFFTFAIYVAKVLPKVESKLAQCFVIGVSSGILGVALNAILIDVFEASKVAFVMWALIGICVGLLKLYQKEPINFFKAYKNVLISIPALIIYFLIGGFVLFGNSLNNYFVGDDFTWIRWVADCTSSTESVMKNCGSLGGTISSFFTDSQGFFYRPGTKTFFQLAYPVFEIFPLPYHVVSVFLHVTATIFVFLISLKLLRNKFFAWVTALFFLVASSQSEAVFWMSSIGTLITSVCLLGSVWMFMLWKDTKYTVFFILSLVPAFIGTFFHEFGVVFPFLIVGVDSIYETTKRPWKKKWYLLVFFILLAVYAGMRINAQSLWFQGDYAYNLQNMPYNFLGNIAGYVFLILFGVQTLPAYQSIRALAANNVVIMLPFVILSCLAIILFGKYIQRNVGHTDKRIIFFSLLLFIVPLLPFLGLGNIAIRYTYLASFGLLLLLVYCLQKIYESLKNRKYLSYTVVIAIVSLFTLFHVSELQRINAHWKRAGEITNQALISINYAFPKSYNRYSLYFVNVPIKYGEAWIFPVGLNDAVWFNFQNDILKIQVMPSLDDAFNVVEATTSAKVFDFNKDYQIEEVTKEVVTNP